MASLSNLVPAPSTNFVWQPRPPAQLLTSFSGLSSPGFVSGMLRIGNRIYGMIASSLNSGKDQPFVYEILTNTFVSVSGITSANTPVSPATSGDWTPPVIFQAGSRIIVTHPGFPGGTVKFGWFDISGLSTTAVADETINSAVLTGAPNILGIQPGLAITGTGVPASTSVVLAANAFTAISFTANSHTNFTLDNVSPGTGSMRAGFAIVGPGIPPGTTITSIQSGTSLTLSQDATSSVTGGQFYMLGPATSPLNMTSCTVTAGSTTVSCTDTTGIWTGQTVSDIVAGVIPQGVTVTSVVANTSFDISAAAVASGQTSSLQFSGNVIIMSQNATATNDSITFAINGGSAAAPQWGAGDTQPNNLPSTPLGGAQMNGRAYFACGTDGIPFSDSGFPCQISDTARVQALTTSDGLPVTAIGALTLASLLGGQVQSLIAFEGSSKMQQITGDLATYNLAMNSLPVATGTDAPNTITNCELGVAFVSPEGLRIIDFTGRISPPVGDHGEGITVPFIFSVVPSRMCAAANADTIRITTQNGAKPNDPYEEYCYDMTRKAWYGPHTSTFSLIEPWSDQFVGTLIGTNAKLFSSTVIPVLTSSWVENGTQLVWQYEPVYLMPDNGEMAMNALVEMTITCGGPDCSSTAPPEAVLYTPPPIGGPPLQPGPTPPTGNPVPPNTPPLPPGQPPPLPPTACVFTPNAGAVMSQTAVQAISGDGTKLFGQGIDGFGNPIPVYWLKSNSAETLLDTIPVGLEGQVFGCSTDGTIAVGYLIPNVLGASDPVWWNVGTLAFTAMNQNGAGIYAKAYACSSDASIIFGEASRTNNAGITDPVWWAKVTGVITVMTGLDAVHSSTVRCCSSDGSIAGGFSRDSGSITRPCWWDQGTGAVTQMSDLGGTGGAQVLGCSSDGSVFVGFAYDVSNSYWPVYWLKSDGSITKLQTQGTTNSGQARCISPDGTVIAGQGTIIASGTLAPVYWATRAGAFTELLNNTGQERQGTVLAAANTPCVLGGQTADADVINFFATWWSD